MTLSVELPDGESLELDHVVLDLTGTLTARGEVIPGVAERLRRVREALEPHIVSSDTFGRLADVAAELGISGHLVDSGAEKVRFLDGLGPARCVAIGNGANDAGMLAAARLGIAVVGPEGAAGTAIRVADVVCGSILEALDLLLDRRLLVATLRP